MNWTTRKQVADDLGAGKSTLKKWITLHRDTDVVSKEGLDHKIEPIPNESSVSNRYICVDNIFESEGVGQRQSRQ